MRLSLCGWYENEPTRMITAGRRTVTTHRYASFSIMRVCGGLWIAPQTRSEWCGQNSLTMERWCFICSCDGCLMGSWHISLCTCNCLVINEKCCESIYRNSYMLIGAAIEKNWNNLSTRNGRNQIILFARTAVGPFHTELVGSLKMKHGNELSAIFHSLCILLRQWVGLIMHRITMKLSCEAPLLLSLPALCTTRVWSSPIELYRVPIMHFYHDKCESIPNEWQRFKSSDKQSSKQHDQDLYINFMKEWTSATDRMRAIALILSETHELDCSTWDRREKDRNWPIIVARKNVKHAQNQNYKWIGCVMRVFSHQICTQHLRARIYTMSLSCLAALTARMFQFNFKFILAVNKV